MAAVATLCGALTLAPAALAGPPLHSPLPGDPLNGFPLDKACGAATDSVGDVYVANAGNDAIEVFDPDGNHLATIADANEPCGLAVDGSGRLYVSEQAVGNVVRYDPDAYPLTATPLYSAATTIDSSGDARGVSVDRVDDKLFVARGDHVAVYKSSGASAAVSEVQRLLVEASAGTYILSFEGQPTASLPYNASSAQVQAALEALPAIGAGNVAVTPGPSAPGAWAGDHLITFQGALANAQLPPLTADNTGLSGGFGASIATTVEGFSGRIGDGDLLDARGVGAYTAPSGDHYVTVTDSGDDAVKIFSGADLFALQLRRSVDAVDHDHDPGSADQSLGFGAAGSAVAVDPFNGGFLVYDDAHAAVNEFEAPGEFLDQVADSRFADAAPAGLAVFPERDEVQEVTTFATGGTYTLSFDGQTTDPIGFNATATDVRSALEALPNVDAGDVSVYASRLSSGGGTYDITFSESLGARDVPQLTGNGAGLSGESHSVGIQTTAQGSGPGRLYVGAGAGGPGAKLLAFAPLARPSRPPREDLSRTLPQAGAVAVDGVGDVYLGAAKAIYVYAPSGAQLAKIDTARVVQGLAVDSTGLLYARFGELGGAYEDQEVSYYTPSSYPPQSGTTYSGPTQVADGTVFASSNFITAIAVDPVSDRLLIGGYGRLAELGSAAAGSPVLDDCFACGVTTHHHITGLALDPDRDRVYIAEAAPFTKVEVVNPDGSERLARFDASTSPRGAFVNAPGSIAVDRASGHLVLFNTVREVAEEYDASGALVAEFGEFTRLAAVGAAIAVDNSGGANARSVYVAFDDTAPDTFDLTAFGPLTYGEPPLVATGIASGIDAGEATLGGTVDPRGFDPSDCHFEYLTDAAYQGNGQTFAGAASLPCAEGIGAIGHGIGAVSVHADLAGLDPEGRYRYRLLAANKFGVVEGAAGLFGPPSIDPRSAQPVLYTEATLRATVDPAGLPTAYHFDYGAGAFDHATSEKTIPAGDQPVAIEAPIGGLAEGTEYKFRLVVENDAKALTGPEQNFTTLARPAAQDCPKNEEFRTGFSASLPDCRAYELVTPADTGGYLPNTISPGSSGDGFNSWLVAPRGPGAGERVTYGIYGTLPGFNGAGQAENYAARRADGAHPADGWSNELLSPSYPQLGGGGARVQGTAADGEHWLYKVHNNGVPAGGIATGEYLRGPGGFEPLGEGSLGTDIDARSRYLSAGADHAIFESAAHLEPAAAPAGTTAVYDRVPGAAIDVVSVKPDGTPFAAGENATYVGAAEDGSAVAFSVANALYLHRNGQTAQVAAAPALFAGVSTGGARVFYTTAPGGGLVTAPGTLYACDLVAGPCAGAGAHAPTQIAANAVFVNVAPDGSRALFSSTDVLTGAEQNDAGETAQATQPNLYSWDGSGIHFVALLDPADFADFEGLTGVTLASWPVAARIFRAYSPTRATPDGAVFAFQSHARLTAYDNGGQSEIYRYDPAAAPGARLLCVSCDPTGAPPSAGAVFHTLGAGGVIQYEATAVPNLSDDGDTVVFESLDQLLPEDANSVRDVYRWRAPGSGGCGRPGGCLALISSGQGERPSHLYGMSADAHDIIIETEDKLVGADVAGSASLYDARVQGGIPDPPAPAPCQGDACQGQGSTPPGLPSPASAGSGNGNVQEGTPKPRCAKGKRKVRRNGKTRCVKKHQKRRRSHRANGNRRAAR